LVFARKEKRSFRKVKLSKNEMSETKSPITPLADRVVVRPLTDEELGTVSAAGIIIPDSAKKEKPEQGVIIAVGPGKWDEDGEKRLPLEVKIGDRVVFSKYAHDEVKIDDKEYFIVGESSILGVFNS
jgi:chaperonin GroES